MLPRRSGRTPANGFCKVAAEIGYYHNKAASNLASRRFAGLRHHPADAAGDRIYLPFRRGHPPWFERDRADYVLQTIDYARGREAHVLGALLSHRVQAILLPSIGHTPETEGLLQSLPIPLIEVGNLPKRPIHFAVGRSDFDAGYLATRRLIEGGRRQEIAIICGRVRDTSNARDRLNGYSKALREGG